MLFRVVRRYCTTENFSVCVCVCDDKQEITTHNIYCRGGSVRGGVVEVDEEEVDDPIVVLERLSS